MAMFWRDDENTSREHADCFIATSTATILAGIAAAGATTAAAKMGSNAANNAARLSTDAANHAADVQGQSAREALEFQKTEAARDRAREEVTRKADYEQWAAHRRGLGSLAGLLGFAAPEIPGYVPLEPGGAPTSAAAPTGAPDPRFAEVFTRATTGLAPTAENLPIVIDALQKAGIKVNRGTHAGNQPSDDFITFDGGGGFDVIQNVGSPNARWQMLPPRAAGSTTRAAGAPIVRQTTPRVAIAPGIRPRSLYDLTGAN